MDNLVSILMIKFYNYISCEVSTNLTWGEGVARKYYFCGSLLSSQKEVIKKMTKDTKKYNKIKEVMS